jgi:bifunctional non-homologous end joining protein LigD
MTASPAAARTRRTAAADDVPHVAGVRISHPDRIIYPDLHLTKLDLAKYYEALGEWIVPHVAGRPLTLCHCPNGLLGPCAFMRHRKAWGPQVLRRVRIREKTKVGEYLVADDLTAVVGLVQMGVVEIHTWNSTMKDVERPDRLIWDLDPGPDVGWGEVVEAARTVRQLLEVLGLACWVKTTGGKGLHVVVPIRPRREWSECLAFARAVATAMVRSDPSRYTVTYAKRGRERQILVDYLRNNRTNTSVSAYSTRARAGAPVSVPISWDELGARLKPSRFSIRAVLRRLSTLGADPWAGYWTSRQQVTDVALSAVSDV